MKTFTYRGTNRAGTAVAGEMAANNKTELQNMLRRQQITRHQNVGEGQGIQSAYLRRWGNAQGTGGVYAAVLGDDRRRVAAGAVPGDSGQPARE